MSVIDLDLTDRELYRNGFPHDLFSELRARGAVLRHSRVTLDRAPEGIEFWAIVRHAEVQAASRDAELFSSLDGPSLSPAHEVMKGQAVVYADPPDHTKLRKLISAGFTPRMIARLDDQIGTRVTAILDDAEAHGPDIDFARDVAFPLPMHVIADIVGIPAADRPHVFALTDTIMRGGDATADITPEERLRAQVDLYRYANELGVEKRAHPADDVWSILAARGITDFQLDLFFLVLSIAGSETTKNVIALGLAALAERPADLEALRADPSLWETATDELIRWASPVTAFGRRATRDTELGGAPIKAGDRVAVFYPSANRDERAFTEPFRLDLRRSPNPHVSFGGGGPHYCLGAHLARREVRTMFEQLLARFDGFELTGKPVFVAGGPDDSVACSVDAMPVRLTPRH